MALIVGKKAVFSLTKSGEGVSLAKVGEVPSSSPVLCAASGSKDVLYYVCEDDPTQITQWNMATGSTCPFSEVPTPVNKLRFYRNKVYCAPAEGTRLMCIDPLNLSVDLLDTHHSIADFEPADHGFVIEGNHGMLIGYHFNDGSCKVNEVNSAQLLGHYKRYAVVMSPDRSEPIGVNEKGEVVHPPSIPTGLDRDFVSTEDGVFVYRKGTQTIETLGGAATCTVPADLAQEGVICFSSVPEQENEDACTLCFCEFEGDGDGITLDCGHRFHVECVFEWVRRWDEFKAKGNHVVFTNAVCPGGCKHLVRHPLLGALSESIFSMFQNVTRKSKAILKQMPATKLDEDLLFYVCSKCARPFYGGEKVCFRTQGGEPTKSPADLVCDDCQNDFTCSRHGRDFVVYKCCYCCNPATERSFGNRYICERCSARWISTTEPEPLPCPGADRCPVGGNGHPEKAYPIGCLACLSDGTLDYDRITPPPATGTSQPSSP